MSEIVIRTASARQSDIARRAQALGIDEALISELVDAFYDRVRANPELGPVFAAAIGDDWAPHLQTMKQFWSSIALNAGSYGGRPVPAHHKHLDKIRPEHFSIWLALFAETLRDRAPTPEAAAFFMERAERISESFQNILFN
ncbi:group III truncated hemoglobin [Oceanicaulis sp. MMSF_3324]|uniref:group III truncated hemoglobin n=1 Tax=Oceanicaulis sp. MMSF_3324 TaxID=3046702 RepID=UPI00273F6937|nr:group III truncated hemoglobin [Oceanicaulis sp. MMSF_3324]